MIAILPAHSFTFDGANINIYHANQGEGLLHIEHIYSHAIFCTSGSVIISKEGKELTITKTTTPVNLLGGEWHEIEALENDTVFINIFDANKQT